jgi:serine/threonine protein kinase
MSATARDLTGQQARARREELIGQFEAAWRRESRPRIEDFLPENAVERHAVLVELIHVDLELRLKAGERARVEEYLARFPELDPPAVTDLIRAEYAWRLRMSGSTVPWDEYLERFPPYRAALKGRPELDELTGGLINCQPNGPAAPNRPNFLQTILSPPVAPDEIGRLGEAGGSGEYRILGILGEGGMGMVLKGEQLSLSRPVALKVMKPDRAASPHARARFKREARAAAAVEHPRIVIIYTVGEFNGTPFIAMPLMKGQSLASQLLEQKPLPLAEGVRYAREMAEGLAAAHVRNLIHRDIKPENVWLEETPDGVHVRLLDFGLVSCDEGEQLSHTNAVIGTPAYMAPEQAEGRKVDARADLFSLGCVLYQMTTGRRAFSGPSTMAVLLAVANHNPSSAGTLKANIPANLSALIDRLLSKNAEGRPASAAAVVSALRDIERGLTVDRRTIEKEEPVPTNEARADPRRSRRGWMIGAGIVLAGIALVCWVSSRTPRTNSDATRSTPDTKAGVQVDPPPDAAKSEFRVKAIELKHYQTLEDGKHRQLIGLLGKESFTPAKDDCVTIETRLSRPGYGYLLAFRPDGKFDLCVPVDENEPPRITNAIVYHPTNADEAYELKEGTGLWVFAVVASETQLPPFNEWKGKLIMSNVWKPTPALPGTLWVDDGVWMETRTAGGVYPTNRGLGAKLEGPEQSVKAITDWLRAAGIGEGVMVSTVGFGVGKK